MSSEPLSNEILSALSRYDTPTICNSLELVDPALRLAGFSRRPLICPFPTMRPVVGYARTAIIRCSLPSRETPAARRAIRLAYYEYIEQGPWPSVAVIQDADGPDRGLGAFWGEVQTNIHLALGCVGVVTDGSAIR